MLSSKELERAFEQAKRYLSRRPQSEEELKAKLRRRGFEERTINRVIQKLRELELLDDLAFARAWKEDREFFRPRSKRLLASELRQKGLSSEIIAEVVAEVDDESEAYRAGLKKARSLAHKDYVEFKRKLAAYLGRRGFDWEVIKSVTLRLWQEGFGGEKL